jgi:hypothetical protein
MGGPFASVGERWLNHRSLQTALHLHQLIDRLKQLEGARVVVIQRGPFENDRDPVSCSKRLTGSEAGNGADDIQPRVFRETTGMLDRLSPNLSKTLAGLKRAS